MTLTPPPGVHLPDDTTLVPAWSDMTPREQAHHLVYEHGFDISYFDHGLGEMHPLAVHLEDNEGVAIAFEHSDAAFMETISKGYSFPCMEGRDNWHDEDHAEHQYGGSDRAPHVHALPASKPGVFEDGASLRTVVVFGVGAFVLVFGLLWLASSLRGAL